MLFILFTGYTAGADPYEHQTAMGHWLYRRYVSKFSCQLGI
ncbi:hypothetical protein [Bartonella grahamii]|nr:hypothetical protein [Bartonella grahamii]